MSDRTNKPMMTSEHLVVKMRDEKGITFKYVTEEKAEVYLRDSKRYVNGVITFSVNGEGASGSQKHKSGQKRYYFP